jgi:hypothetical protein
VSGTALFLRKISEPGDGEGDLYPYYNQLFTDFFWDIFWDYYWTGYTPQERQLCILRCETKCRDTAIEILQGCDGLGVFEWVCVLVAERELNNCLGECPSLCP